MLIEAAKGGHTSVVCYLLDYPNNLLSAPPPDVTQFTPPSHDLNRVIYVLVLMKLGFHKVPKECKKTINKLAKHYTIKGP